MTSLASFLELVRRQLAKIPELTTELYNTLFEATLDASNLRNDFSTDDKDFLKSYILYTKNKDYYRLAKSTDALLNRPNSTFPCTATLIASVLSDRQLYNKALNLLITHPNINSPAFLALKILISCLADSCNDKTITELKFCYLLITVDPLAESDNFKLLKLPKPDKCLKQLLHLVALHYPFDLKDINLKKELLALSFNFDPFTEKVPNIKSNFYKNRIQRSLQAHFGPINQTLQNELQKTIKIPIIAINLIENPYYTLLTTASLYNANKYAQKPFIHICYEYLLPISNPNECLTIELDFLVSLFNLNSPITLKPFVVYDFYTNEKLLSVLTLPASLLWEKIPIITLTNAITIEYLTILPLNPKETQYLKNTPQSFQQLSQIKNFIKDNKLNIFNILQPRKSNLIFSDPNTQEHTSLYLPDPVFKTTPIFKNQKSLPLPDFENQIFKYLINKKYLMAQIATEQAEIQTFFTLVFRLIAQNNLCHPSKSKKETKNLLKEIHLHYKNLKPLLDIHPYFNAYEFYKIVLNIEKSLNHQPHIYSLLPQNNLLQTSKQNTDKTLYNAYAYTILNFYNQKPAKILLATLQEAILANVNLNFVKNHAIQALLNFKLYTMADFILIKCDFHKNFDYFYFRTILDFFLYNNPTQNLNLLQKAKTAFAALSPQEKDNLTYINKDYIPQTLLNLEYKLLLHLNPQKAHDLKLEYSFRPNMKIMPNDYHDEQLHAIMDYYSAIFGDLNPDLGQELLKRYKIPFFVSSPTNDTPYYTIATIGSPKKLQLADIPQTPYFQPNNLLTDFVITLPPQWDILSDELIWKWPLLLLKYLYEYTDDNSSINEFTLNNFILMPDSIIKTSPYLGVITKSLFFKSQQASYYFVPDGRIIFFLYLFPITEDEITCLSTINANNSDISSFLQLHSIKPEYIYNRKSTLKRFPGLDSIFSTYNHDTDYAFAHIDILLQKEKIALAYKHIPYKHLENDKGWRFFTKNDADYLSPFLINQYLDPLSLLPDNYFAVPISLIKNLDPYIALFLNAKTYTIYQKVDDEQYVYIDNSPQ